MSIKYEVARRGETKITQRACIMETTRRVWIELTDSGGRKHILRRSKKYIFFDTWKEAHNFLLVQTNNELQSAKITLEHKENNLALVEAMTEPKAESQP